MTKDQENHVKQYGKDRYHRVLVAAAITARADARLIAADKMRRELSEHAALEAIGYPRKPFMPSKACGVVTPGIDAIVQEVFARAYEAAREVAGGAS